MFLTNRVLTGTSVRLWLHMFPSVDMYTWKARDSHKYQAFPTVEQTKRKCISPDFENS